MCWGRSKKWWERNSVQLQAVSFGLCMRFVAQYVPCCVPELANRWSGLSVYHKDHALCIHTSPQFVQLHSECKECNPFIVCILLHFCNLGLTKIERGVQCAPCVTWISAEPYLTPGRLLISHVSTGRTPGRVEHVHYLKGSERQDGGKQRAVQH